MMLTIDPSQEITILARRQVMSKADQSAADLARIRQRSPLSCSLLTGIVHDSQEKDLWCWAACLWMVRISHEPTALQCRIAEERFPRKPCCRHPRACNLAQPLHEVGPFWDRWLATLCAPIGTKAEEGQVRFETIADELDAGRPVLLLVNGSACTSRGQLTGAGHLVLVADCSNSGARGQTLEIHDPEQYSGPTQVAFDALTLRWSWSATWTQIGC